MTEPALFQDLPKPPSGFDDLWSMWPHKVDKKNSLKAYRSALRRASRDEIMAGVEWYIRNKPDWCQWKSLSAWLNGDRWQDGREQVNGADPDLKWKHIAESAKRPWGRHRYPRQDLEECVRRGLLTAEEMRGAL